ncbi:hypothetical protein OF83DRAFT_133147 [Amylostereum chailletii]|nr:hypothetical protein OF83DRAFT_133147 [Amylostereum chailletii]
MSTIVDVSSKLGEYMLKGWVLTDKQCPTKGCRVPLMRSPNGISPQTWFCANCEGNGSAEAAPLSSVSNLPSSPSMTSSTHYSRPSTPPTEVSSTLSSPTFAPPMETEELLQRRHQSDIASSEMARLLLKGWAMLAEECINPTCYGIPLVRPPKAGGEKDPRKECVVCGTVYVDEKDVHGYDRLVPIGLSGPGRHQFNSVPGPPVFRSKDKGKAVARDETPVVHAIFSTDIILADMSMQLQASDLPSLSIPSPSVPRRGVNGTAYAPSTSKVDDDRTMPSMSSSTHATLNASAQALESSLKVLTTRLTTLTNQPAFDPSALGSTADAMAKTAQALSQVLLLQHPSTA